MKKGRWETIEKLYYRLQELIEKLQFTNLLTEMLGLRQTKKQIHITFTNNSKFDQISKKKQGKLLFMKRKTKIARYHSRSLNCIELVYEHKHLPLFGDFFDLLHWKRIRLSLCNPVIVIDHQTFLNQQCIANLQILRHSS